MFTCLSQFTSSLISSHLLSIRSRCSDTEELAVEKLEDILPAIDKGTTFVSELAIVVYSPIFLTFTSWFLYVI